MVFTGWEVFWISAAASTRLSSLGERVVTFSEQGRRLSEIQGKNVMLAHMKGTNNIYQVMYVYTLNALHTYLHLHALTFTDTHLPLWTDQDRRITFYSFMKFLFSN